MPSHDYSFVNTPLLLLPSAFPFHLSALSRWMTAWLQSPRLLRPNLPIVVPNLLPWQQLPVVPGFKNRFSEPEAGWEMSGALCAPSSECNTDTASEILSMRSAWADSRQRRMVGCHPLKIQGDRLLSVRFHSFAEMPRDNVPAYAHHHVQTHASTCKITVAVHERGGKKRGSGKGQLKDIWGWR